MRLCPSHCDGHLTGAQLSLESTRKELQHQAQNSWKKNGYRSILFWIGREGGPMKYVHKYVSAGEGV